MASRAALRNTLSLDDVNPDRVFRCNFLPELGLEPDLAFPFRVYVLLCRADFNWPYSYYVGIAPRDEVVKRIGDHRQRRGAGFDADFTAANPPLSVLFLYPAATRAMESYVYSAIMTQLPENAITNGRLGGWTQTSPRSSLTEETRRQAVREWRMVNNC